MCSELSVRTGDEGMKTVKEGKEADNEKENGKKCAWCGKVIARDMARHMRVHTGEKSHTCCKCGKGFSRSDACKTHEEGCGEGRKRGRPPKQKGDNDSAMDEAESTVTKRRRV